MDIKDIPAVIDKERERRGIEIKDLCTSADMSWSAYYHWLDGTTSPKASMLSRVMDVLDLEIKVVRRHG